MSRRGRKGGRSGARRGRRGGRRRDRPRPAPLGGELEVEAERYRLREASVTVAFETEGARFDLFADSGGARPAGLVLDSLLARGIDALAALSGAVVIDPPPGLLLPRAPAAWQARAARALERAGGEPELEGANAECEGARDAEEVAGDDDPELGPIESYRARRAERGLLERDEVLPELDEAALAEAEAQALSERAVLTPRRTYWIERARVAFGAIERGQVELEIHAEARAIGPEGELDEAIIRVHARLRAALEVA